ncbi:MAG: formate dehydrogenase accessory sulfurtransferase FdhD [Asticcacaulis sp.]
MASASTRGLIATPQDIVRLDIVAGELGIEARMWLKPERGHEVAARRRSRTGPTGCGLCGVESLEDAVRPRAGIEALARLTLTPAEVIAAAASLEPAQIVGAQTRAVHAAGFWTPEAGLVMAREDVGRHNALDKLAGALARAGVDGRTGAVVLTSRVSVEMVQKTVAIGAPVLIAISARPPLALRTAEAAGLTIVAVARRDGFEIFTRPGRISLDLSDRK